ncbi:16S rRNA (uracil(1498)-N(3))-methyltransferase [Mangrovitalea sediminis]|uniref:16S rRNA (uracil(1498)-N(3))-methyltransferase n=1 Tax=Mangrovitalea sediminis TaxID=1982043 RepID=UPI000BE56950|nr:16S rRNA (uracil(1498)-N(3))-methyltransferase [Mangrovitalea sediminis]
MNLALLLDEDFIADDRVLLRGRRRLHLDEVIQAQPGHRLPVGRLNGLMGTGELLRLTDEEAELRVHLDREPPQPLPVTLILALPRPKMLKRVIQNCATMGVKRLYLINSYKVEKSFWQSPWLGEEKLQENLILGLEQGMDTRLPQVTLCKRFKPFVEDELPAIASGSRKLVAHPGTGTACPTHVDTPVTLCIGPEGGFIPYEVEKLIETGFEPVHLGPRILRVETAVPVLLTRLFDSTV